ncbi:MAG: hypothetical protein ACI9BO_002263 [Zhongshania sp.]|jgi:hypothetical protein
MSKIFITISLGVGLALLSLNVHAAKAGYYQWSDDKGKQHFSQQPPIGRKYLFIETSSGASMSSDGIASSAENSDNDDSDVAKAEKIEIVPPKDPELCAKAESNMRSLAANGARIRISNIDGTTRFLSPAEIAEQKNRAQDVITLHCK